MAFNSRAAPAAGAVTCLAMGYQHAAKKEKLPLFLRSPRGMEAGPAGGLAAGWPWRWVRWIKWRLLKHTSSL